MPFTDSAAKRASFEAEALPFAPALYGAALRLSRDTDVAADLVQESLLRAYRTYDNFEPGTNCRAWLFTILYSVFFNWQRKQRREVGLTPEALEAQFAAYLDSGATDAAEPSGEMSSEVERSLSELPEPFRLAVILVDVEQQPHDAAAAQLRCPVATLRTRLFRGRRLLAALLREHGRRAGYDVGGGG